MLFLTSYRHAQDRVVSKTDSDLRHDFVTACVVLILDGKDDDV